MEHRRPTLPRRHAAARRARPWPAALAAALIAASVAAAPASAKDDDKPAKPALPNIYLDLSTTAITIPANSLALGFGGGQWLSRLQLSSPAAIGIGVSVPLTVDLNDQLSVFAGVYGSALLPDNGPWSSFEINSWMAGFTWELYQQNGGAFPTVTLQSTLSGPTIDWRINAYSVDTNLEFGYALDADETRGVLAGLRYIHVMVDSGILTVDSPFIAYLGGYYQWPSNWKATVRAGLQHFGGAHLGAALTPIKAFTQPVLRIDLDQMDDNDNRLFGVSGQIAWTPTPSYMLTLRTPLYAVRN
jgi:hypothetical protein